MSRDRFRGPPQDPEEQEREAERLALQALQGLQSGADIISADVAERRAKAEKDRRLRLEEEMDAAMPTRGPQSVPTGMLWDLLTPGGIDPVIQPERGLGRQIGVGPRSSRILEETASSPGFSAAMGMGDVLIAPRAAIGAATEAAGGDYDAAQGEIERSIAENPRAAVGGALVGMAPLMMAGPLVGEHATATLAGRAAIPTASVPLTIAQRAGAAGLEGMAWGGAHEAASGRRVGPEAMFSGALGAGLTAGAGMVGAGVDRARGLVDSLEDYAGRMRVRGAGGRTVQVQRQLDALPGGIEGVADDLDQLGISPRYSLHSVDDARATAERVRGRAGRNLDRVFDRMAQADADDAARFESGMADVTARDATRSRMRSAIEADDPTMVEDLLPVRPRIEGEERLQGQASRRLTLDRTRRSREAHLDDLRSEAAAAGERETQIGGLRGELDSVNEIAGSRTIAPPAAVDRQIRGLERRLDEAVRSGADDAALDALEREIADLRAERRTIPARRRAQERARSRAAELRAQLEDLRAQQERTVRPEQIEALERGAITEAFPDVPMAGGDLMPADMFIERVANNADAARSAAGVAPGELIPQTGRGIASNDPGFGRGPRTTPRAEHPAGAPFVDAPSGLRPPDARSFQLIEELFPAIEPPAPAGTVDLGNVIGNLDEAESIYRTLPSGGPSADDVADMARRYRGTGGRMPFGRPGGSGLPATGAQGERMLLDQDVGYAVSGNPMQRRLMAGERDMRAARQRLQGAMDEAVTRVDPELGASYPRDRREWQIGSIFSGLGEDDALREAANRQVSLTDSMAYIAPLGGDNPSYLQSARNLLLNRIIRGREATAGATGAEYLSDILQRTGSPAPYAQAFGQRAGRLGGALRRPETPQDPLQPRPFQGRELDALLESQPEIDVESEPSSGGSAEADPFSEGELEELLRREYGGGS